MKHPFYDGGGGSSQKYFTTIVHENLQTSFLVSIDCALEWCTAHTKCPPGKYTKAAGTITSNPECAVCPDGFFKGYASSTSTKTDFCTNGSDTTSTNVMSSTSPGSQCMLHITENPTTEGSNHKKFWDCKQLTCVFLNASTL